ncbi:hypothetical protein DPEC_G00150570 [Dallia pectoralis]|uniref:Uncharacterized protein n=1 Tax=Dallia pectoralis TaxID=75939 RepID=A0ACC2GJ34_DALPE|nr:hypothetical protein DPEC_G00150570 [Dallia pectoralis]
MGRRSRLPPECECADPEPCGSSWIGSSTVKSRPREGEGVAASLWEARRPTLGSEDGHVAKPAPWGDIPSHHVACTFSTGGSAVPSDHPDIPAKSTGLVGVAQQPCLALWERPVCLFTVRRHMPVAPLV